jgi:hypothetical protein
MSLQTSVVPLGEIGPHKYGPSVFFLLPRYQATFSGLSYEHALASQISPIWMEMSLTIPSPFCSNSSEHLALLPNSQFCPSQKILTTTNTVLALHHYNEIPDKDYL